MRIKLNHKKKKNDPRHYTSFILSGGPLFLDWIIIKKKKKGFIIYKTPNIMIIFSPIIPVKMHEIMTEKRSREKENLF